MKKWQRRYVIHVGLTNYDDMASHTAEAGGGVHPDAKSIPTTGTRTHGCPWTIVVVAVLLNDAVSYM